MGIWKKERTMKHRLCGVLGLAAVMAWAPSAAEPGTVIRNKGSYSMLGIAQTWAVAYQKANPDVTVSVSGGGSTVGVAGLIYGMVDIANSSRAMRDKELRLMEKRRNKAKEHVVAYGALTVFIHGDNPLESISLPQLAEIYEDGGTIGKWSDLGVEVPGCGDGKIVPVGRQVNSGTYLYFRNAVLGEGRGYDLDVLDMHGSTEVMTLVSEMPCAIGYGAVTQATPNVKLACIAREEGEPCVRPSLTTITDSSYPIARPVFMYTADPPSNGVRRYLGWVLSDAGQCLVRAQGCAPARAVECD